MTGCGRVLYTAGFRIGVVAVSGDHRSEFGLRFGLGIVWATVLCDKRCIRFPLCGLSRHARARTRSHFIFTTL